MTVSFSRKSLLHGVTLTHAVTYFLRPTTFFVMDTLVSPTTVYTFLTSPSLIYLLLPAEQTNNVPIVTH
jgi:hypothetical protein